jgi:hypothetical protein
MTNLNIVIKESAIGIGKALICYMIVAFTLGFVEMVLNEGYNELSEVEVMIEQLNKEYEDARNE